MFPTLALALPDYFYFVLAVCGIVSVCVLLFYAKRHPNPHFRPRKSDLALVAFVLMFASAGTAYMTASMLDADFDKEKLNKKMEDAKKQGKGAGSVDPANEGTGGGGDREEGGSDLPEDLPDDVREAIEGS